MSKTWPGVVKVKMLHRQGATILLPEILVIGGAGYQWVQPQFVYAPQLGLFDGDEGHASIQFAAIDRTRQRPDGLTCEITFTRSDRCAALPDRSEVYRCRITTAHSPSDLAIGRAHLRADGGIDVRLHHHTAPVTLPLIHSSGHVRASAWNYQGTRELVNVGYTYFTSLRHIRNELDLQSIAMASEGRLYLQLDTTYGSSPDCVVEVYRQTTRDRTATLTLWVPGEAISTPHIWQHMGPAVNYEIAHPWTYRVGLQPGGHLDFQGKHAAAGPATLKRFDYAVIGDCTTIAGLKAPFDEENTAETFAAQDLSASNIFDFWRAHANTPIHSPPTVTQVFKP